MSNRNYYGRKLMSMYFLLALFFASCAKQANQEAQERIPIEIWSWGAGEMQSFADAVADEFPQVDFTINAFPMKEYQNKLQNALRSKSGRPNLFYQGDENMERFFQYSLAVDMKEYGFDPEQELRGNYYDFALDLGMRDGKFLTIGWKVAPTVLFYSSAKTIEYLGTDAPEGIGAMTKTWDGFLKLAQIVSEKSGRRDFMITEFDSFVRAYLRSTNQALIAEDGTINSALIRDAYTYMKSLIDLRVVSDTSGSNAVGNLYPQGRLFSVAAAPWALPFILKAAIPDSSGEWRSTYLAPSFQGYWGLIVNPYSEHIQTSVDIIKAFTTNPQRGFSLLSPLNDFPADKRITAMMKDNTFEFLNGQNPLALWQESAEHISIGPSFGKNSNLAMKIVGAPVLSMILDSSVTVDDAVESFVQDALTSIPGSHR